MADKKENPNAPSLCAGCCFSSRPPGAGFVICHVPDDDCLPKCLRLTLNAMVAPAGLIRTICCVPCGLKCYYFNDSKFPPKSISLGKFGGMTQHQLDQEVTWKRAGDLFDGNNAGDCTRRTPAALFYGKAEPADIEQGELGDCWLMTSIACLASVSNGSLHNLFVTKEYSMKGKYIVRLFDGLARKWKRVVIDDFIPCHTSSGKPLFAKPNDRELWCILMEKAMAKTMGGYDLLDGGNILVGFQALTGDPVYHLTKEGDKFRRFDLTYFNPDKSKKDEFGRVHRSIGLKKTSETFNKDQLFDVLREMCSHRALVGAGTGGVDQGTSTAKQGLVQGHAYSVLNVKEVSEGGLIRRGEKFRLVQLRNPWGSFEWTGAWSDHDSNWTKYKNIAKKLKHDAKHGGDDENDGIFWMPYDEFWNNFAQIDLCDRSVGFGDLAIEIDEAQGFCGPARGCAYGCFKYWCMCKMCRASTFGHVGGEPMLTGKDYFSEVSYV